MPSNVGDTGHSDAVSGGRPIPGYETRDANPDAVLGFLGFLFLILAVTLLGTLQLFRHYSVTEQPAIPASSFAGVRQIPSGPELEVKGREDLRRTYAKQQQELETYAWEDRKNGIVRIPIERAMDLVLQKGLPVVSSAAEGESPADSAPNTRQERREGNN